MRRSSEDVPLSRRLKTAAERLPRVSPTSLRLFPSLVVVLLQDIRNTVGNIPMEWYKDFPHIGYNLDGKKIFKPIRNKDELDEFLDKMENPDYW